MKLRTISRALHNYAKIACAISAGLAIIHTQSVRAGWTGMVSGNGFGWVYVDMTSSYGYSNSKFSGFLPSPGESIPNDAPPFASYLSYAYGAGYGGGYMQGSAIGYYGDGAGNAAIEARRIITPGDCAELNMDAFLTPGPFTHGPYTNKNTGQVVNGIDFDPTTKSGTITVNSKGNAGTGFLLTGWEIPDGLDLTLLTPPPANSFPTNIYGVDYLTLDEFLAKFHEFLKAKGAKQVSESLLFGNHEYGSNGKCSLIIPYTLESGNPNNLLIKWDGAAKSTPLVVNFPQDMPPVECGQAVNYPDVTVSGGCGLTNLFSKYSPASTALSLGPNTVTVEITDDLQHTNVIRTNTFVVTIVDTTKPVITATGTPLNGVLGLNPTPQQIEAALGTATATDNCGSVTPNVQTGSVIANGCSRTQIRTWTLTDASGNAATPVFRTVTWTEDTTPPTVSLAAYSIPCGATLPVLVPVPTTFTSSDNCGGPVTVVETQPQSYNGTGAGVTWTFQDAVGNQVQVVQSVVATIPTFQGFYEPIGTVNNAFNAAVTRNLGSTLPIKFDLKCGTTYITGGTPPKIKVQRWSNATTPVGPVFELGAVFQNNWHNNSDFTEVVGPKKNEVFRITVFAPGSETAELAHVFIKFK